MIGLLTTLLFAAQADTTKVYVDNIHNCTTIEQVGGRDIKFGLKEVTEEILVDNGFFLTDSVGLAVQVLINKIESPAQVLNIMGTKWLKKDYIIETEMCIGTGCFKGTAKKSAYVFAMFLEVENNEVPLNKKTFSKTLHQSIKNAYLSSNK